MKQLIKLGMLLAFGGVMASCSNDKLDNPGNNYRPGIPEGEAYLSVSIAMPNSVSSRDTSDPEFDDGTEDEYKVNNGMVVIFQKAGEGEGDYLFVSKGNLDTYAWGLDGDQLITTTSKTAIATFDASSLDTSTGNDSPKYYALVVLNYNTEADITSMLKAAVTSTDDNGASTAATKFKDWQTSVLTNDDVTKIYKGNGFTMTNAPLLTSDGSVFTLVEIDKSKIGTNPSNLEPAACIFVQRIASKVTVATSTGNSWGKFMVTIPGVEEANDYVVFSGWGLDVTNKFTYPVQVADNYSSWTGESTTTTPAAWFKSIATLTDHVNNNATYNRIFWGEDPNYDDSSDKQYYYLSDSTGASDPAGSEDKDDEDPTYTEMNFFRLNTSDASLHKLGTDEVDTDYCLENTMEYNHMLQRETTTAIFKGVYHVDGKEKAESFINFGSWKVVLDKDFYNATAILEGNQDAVLKLKDEITEGKSKTALTDLFELTEKGEEAYLKVLNPDEEDSDELQRVDATEPEKTLTPEEKKAGVLYFINEITDAKVDYYHNGEVYYRARIHHFDPTDTPRPGNFASVNDYKKDHRGRFGVLRNNWYEVVVNSITGVGDPTIPNFPPDDPTPDDDPDKQYMNAEIHILSWAKRSYNYDF